MKKAAKISSSKYFYLTLTAEEGVAGPWYDLVLEQSVRNGDTELVYHDTGMIYPAEGDWRVWVRAILGEAARRIG